MVAKHLAIRHFAALVLLLLVELCYSQNFTISGYVRDGENGENLIGATIYDSKSGKGTVTNTYGFYSLTLPSDSVKMTVTFVGFQAQSFAIDLKSSLSLNVDMVSGDILNEVIIIAEESIEVTPQMSTIDVGVEQIKAIPALMGEADVLKSIQLLPGVQSGSEGSSGIYVRGGGPDQNLILLDGVPVYNASHLFGFFSVFNADAINKVSITKGGFPARYGGRLSSVLDISMKEGNNQKVTGTASIGLISSKLTVEGPIKNEKTSFIVSARRTYIDILTRPLIKAATEGDNVAGYFFYDLNAKVNHTFSNKDRLFLSFYGGKDKAYARNKYDYFNDDNKYENEDEFGLNWGNVITAVRWNHLFTPKLFSNLTATYSKYEFSVFNNILEEISGPDINEKNTSEIEYSSGIRDFALKLDFDYLPHPDHNLKFGAMAIKHQFNPGVFAFSSNVETDTTLGASKTNADELSIYLEDDFSLSNALRFNVGVHSSMFNTKGKVYNSIQPRISGRLRLPGAVSLKASYSEMAQYIHLLSNGGIGLPTDLWVPVTKNIKPQIAKQGAVGIAKNLGVYELSVEYYYKEMSNLIDYKDGSSYFNSNDDWESKVVSGSGTSYGVELFLQKKTGKLSGWIGYTWSKTDRQFDELNFGKPFPYKYDRRHDASVVGIYQVSDALSLSGTWVFGTGNAISLPFSSYDYVPDPNSYTFRYFDEIEYYDSRNNYRMRSYHRLDLSAALSKKKKRGIRTWSVGAYNAYNRKNPFFIDLSYDNSGNRKFVQYSLFPIIPFAKYTFDF